MTEATKNNGPEVAASEPSTLPTNQSKFYQIATDLIARDVSVIPLEPGQKNPLVGAKSRTRDLEQVESWAAAWPDANVGICADSDITLLETDDEQWMRETIRNMTGDEIPATLTSGSGRPNRVCWIFKRTPECGDKCLEVGGKFEFRNVNQYVAGPGSLHPSGLTYRWIADVPIVEIPSWLLAAIKELDAGYKGTATSTFVKTGPAAILERAFRWDLNPDDMFGRDDVSIAEGDGHYTLLTIAGLLHDGERDSEDAADVLKKLRDEYYQGDKGDEEIDRIVDYVWRKEPCDLEPINLPSYCVWPMVFSSAEEMAKWVAENVDSLEVTRKPAASGGMLVDYDSFLAEAIPPRRVLLTDADTGGEVLLASSINQIFAYRGIGKSLFFSSRESSARLCMVARS